MSLTDQFTKVLSIPLTDKSETQFTVPGYDPDIAMMGPGIAEAKWAHNDASDASSRGKSEKEVLTEVSLTEMLATKLQRKRQS